MTQRQLKISLGSFLVCSQVGLILYSYYLYTLNGFSIEEWTTLLAIIVPGLAGYTTSIVFFAKENAYTLKDTSKKVNYFYIVLAFLFPGVLVAVHFLSIHWKAYNTAFANFEDFKTVLIVMETLFAGYAGLFVYSMFERQPVVGDPSK